MAYCTNCGNQLREGAKFCDSCGYQVASNDTDSKRQTVFEGNIHKCPNCGEVIDAFEAACPSCGYEIRSGSSVSAVRELSLKLEKISERRMPEIEEKRSLVDAVFGNSSKRAERAEEAKAQFAFEKEKEKASLITNFAVPNTKEDIMEFMLLAVSNVESINNLNDEVSKAWITKANQVYQKAKLSMQGIQELETVQSLYQRLKKKVKTKKIKDTLLITVPILLWFYMIGIFWHTKTTLIATGIVLAIIAVIAIIIAIVKLKKRRKKED